MIVLATHMLFLQKKQIYGPANTVSTFLNKTKRDYIFIKHQIEGECLSLIEYYEKGVLKRFEELGTRRILPFGIRHLLELLITIKVTRSQPKKVTLFIGTDPLNAFSANIIKCMGVVEKTVFLCADFSLRRFNNPLMSYVYILFDKAAMFWSAQTWSISQRIVDYRRSQGLEDTKNKILPNAKFFNDIKRLPYKKIHKHDLILVSALRIGIAPFTLLIDVIGEVQKSIHDIRFHIIGSGSEEEMLKKYVSRKKLQKCVKFYGALSNEEMFSVLVKGAIGISVYEESDAKHFRYFSDSMRTRDYLSSGLPVIFSGPSGVGEEILKENAGRIVSLEKNEMSRVIKDILTHPILYQRLRRNALRLAKQYDTLLLLKKYFAALE